MTDLSTRTAERVVELRKQLSDILSAKATSPTMAEVYAASAQETSADANLIEELAAEIERLRWSGEAAKIVAPAHS